MRVDVSIEARIYPTEDPGKVEQAIRSMFEGDLAIRREMGGKYCLVEGFGDSMEALRKFKDLLKRERIRDAAKKFLSSLIREGEVVFLLNKQVAFVNHVSFCSHQSDSPLGPIKIHIKSGDPHWIVDWLTGGK